MKAKTISLILSILLLLQSTPVLAETFGNFEQTLPGFPNSIDAFVAGDKPFLKYATWMINFVTAMIVAIALIVIVVAGYTYMTAGGDGKKVETAKNLIKAALLGIILALTAFLLLNQISPQFASNLRDPLSP